MVFPTLPALLGQISQQDMETLPSLDDEIADFKVPEKLVDAFGWAEKDMSLPQSFVQFRGTTMVAMCSVSNFFPPLQEPGQNGS
eukprot:m.256087 g.256087  ORF g.256087 m.256087 type:complete len:84 (-) comp22697_c0_seq23:227-478(-)